MLIAYPAFVNFPDFQFGLKAKHFHLKYVCLLPDPTKVENVFTFWGIGLQI